MVYRLDHVTMKIIYVFVLWIEIGSKCVLTGYLWHSITTKKIIVKTMIRFGI